MTGKGPDGRSSIYRDDAGRWHGWVSFGTDPTTGRRRRRHVQAPTKAAVTSKVAALERQREAGGGTASTRRMTVAEWTEVWLDAQTSRVRPTTMRGYGPDVRRLLEALGSRRADRVTPADIAALYRRAAAGGASAGTVAHLHRSVAACFAAAERSGLLGRNPARAVHAPSAPPPEVVPLSTGEARAVLAAARGGRNAARWSVALGLGLRQGEALGLRWSDVDLDEGRLSVRGQLAWRRWAHGCGGDCGHDPGRCPLRSGGGPMLVEPKSAAGRRTIALPAPMVAELAAQRAAQDGEASALGDLWDNALGLVFPAVDGRPVRPEADRRRWLALLRSAGVPRRRLHDARHTAATLLLVQGVAPAVAMTLLGHADMGVTRRYQHVVDELRRDAADRVGEALWGAG
jgi:integrase